MGDKNTGGVHIVESYLKYAPIVLFVIYILGFLVWNIYLSTLFNVFEYNFAQIRFLSAGIAAGLILGTMGLLMGTIKVVVKALLMSWLRKINKATECWIYLILKYFAYWLGGLLIVIATFMHAVFIFPKIPQYFGGGKAIMASIVGLPDQIEYLNNLDVGRADNAEGKSAIQTLPVCILYQNDQLTLIGVLMKSSDGSRYGLKRVIYLKNDLYVGLQTRGGYYSKDHHDCSSLDTLLSARYDGQAQP